MALIGWLGENGLYPSLERMQNEINRVFSSYQPRFGGAGISQRPGVYPALNVYDDGESFIVQAEVPGVDPKSIDIMVAGDTLNLQGERKLPELPEGASYHRRERDAGRFKRAMTLPEQVDNSKVKASYNNGMLEILLPRAEQAKQRKVKVTAV